MFRGSTNCHFLRLRNWVSPIFRRWEQARGAPSWPSSGLMQWATRSNSLHRAQQQLSSRCLEQEENPSILYIYIIYIIYILLYICINMCVTYIIRQKKSVMYECNMYSVYIYIYIQKNLWLDVNLVYHNMFGKQTPTHSGFDLLLCLPANWEHHWSHNSILQLSKIKVKTVRN